MSEKLPRSQFSMNALRALDEFSDEDVFDAWVEAMSIFFRPNKIEESAIRERLGLSPDKGEDGLIDVFLFPGMLSARVASSGYHFARTETDVARCANDSIGIMFWENGHYHGSSRGAETRFTPGDIHLVDFSRPIEGYSSPFDTYSLIVPREALMDLEIDLDGLHLTHLSQNTPAVRLLRRHIHELQKEAPNMGVAESRAMVEATVAMVKAVLSLQGEETFRASELIQRNQLLEVRQFIDANLYDPDLNAERIAKAVGLSRTQLYRLFEPLHGIKNFITRRRLRRAFQRLASRADAASITKIAYDLGFNSEDSFRRAFTRAFSMSPKEVRARGLRAYYDISTATPSDGGPTMPTGELLYKRWMDDLFA